MIFTFKPREIDTDPLGWKPCFAWFPTQVGPTKYAWLERIEYRFTGNYESTWDYDNGHQVHEVYHYRRKGDRSE